MNLPVKQEEVIPQEATPQKGDTSSNKPNESLVISDAQIVKLRDEGKISAREGLHLFDRFLARAFPAEVMTGLLKDLCGANDKRYAQGAGFFESPNWDARAEGLKIALQLANAIPESRDKPVTNKIVFNVVNPHKKKT